MEFHLNEKQLHIRVMLALLVLTACSIYLAFFAGDWSFTCLHLFDDIDIFFKVDDVSRMFVVILCIAWLCAGIYSFEYMKHEGKEERFYLFYLLAFIALLGMDFAGNLVTMYMCFEFVTLSTFPLVLHSQSRESVMASLKYLLYSMCGAYMALFGIFVLYRYSPTLEFLPGGSLNPYLTSQYAYIILPAVFVMTIGFGVKCGMFPLHSWLTAAHPVAPSPASAVLSALIVKAGVLGILRTVFFVVGAESVRGTWVQYAWMTFTLITVFMGSMLAYREQVFKKRLAYSTVSQVSYILFGFATLNSTAMVGSLFHIIVHAIIKCGLFLTAGVFLVQCNKKRVGELVGIGKEMPVLLISYTFLSLGLIGIPPTGGFISKLDLALGALKADGVMAFAWVGPMILLISALLTAGYLLPVTMRGFFPGYGYEEQHEGESGKKNEPPLVMLIPIAVLAAITLFIGIFPNPVLDFAKGIAETLI